jgi:hypothetical protein
MLEFLCIGAQKSGTTWLDKCLRQNNDIYLPPIKELNIWNSYYNLGGASIEKLRNRSKNVINKLFDSETSILDSKKIKSILLTHQAILETLENINRYEKLFSKKMVSGEISPDYFLLNSDQWKALSNCIPSDIKVIIIIRNPVMRAWSGCRMYARNIYKLDLSSLNGDDLSNILLTKRLEWLRASDIRTDYINSINAAQKYFKNITIVNYDDLCLNPEKFLEEIISFIGLHWVPDCYKNAIDAKFNFDPKPATMPILVKDFLLNRYKSQIDFCDDLFGADKNVL